MEKAAVAGTVMYIAAHPDDENTRLISWLTNDQKVSVTYLSLTRGDGGQNLIGPEIRDGLGVIRTQELLQARKTDGGAQMFTRANDFGFSKTPEESLEIWDRQQVLADVVWAIRKVRPDVIITRFSTEKRSGRSTHGHHTASAILASEAFDLAGDPKAFPEQLKYVKIWQPKRLLWNTSWWFFGSEDKFNEEVERSPGKYLKLKVSNYIEELGLSCPEIASLSRSHHKSQGFGSTPDRGEEYEYLQLIKGEKISTDLFDGIDLTWKRMGLEDLIKKYTRIIQAFDVRAPHKSIDGLQSLVREIGKRSTDNPELKEQLIEKLNDLIFDCSRVYIEVTSTKELVATGEFVSVNVSIIRRIPDIRLGLIVNRRQGSIIQDRSMTIPLEGNLALKDSIFTTNDMISQPYWLNNQATAGMYFVSEQTMIGAPIAQYPLLYDVELLINGHQLMRRIPVVYSTNDPVKGEVKYPLIVVPRVMINLLEDVYLFKDNSSQEVTTEVLAGADSISGYVELTLPEGWTCEPKFHKVDLSTAGQRQVFSFKVTPSRADYDGRISGYFKTESDVYGLGFQHIKYDHIPPQAIFPSCEARLIRKDVTTDPAITKVGYIHGAGDLVPDALALLGFEVVQLIPAEVSAESLAGCDAIVVGIRAYNTIDQMDFINPLLNDFAKNGGVVVVQYNTSHQLVTDNIGPLPLSLSRNRVTEEDAPVELLAETDPILTWPNKITLADFDNWVQERGLYFPDEWSEDYIPVIRIADANESPNDGSILVSYYGQGKFVYTGISFFRQLPAGVTGAYRLMANLLSNPERK